MQCEPGPWPVPFPRTKPNAVEGGSWHGSPQNKTRPQRIETIESVRRHSATVRPTEASLCADCNETTLSSSRQKEPTNMDSLRPDHLDVRTFSRHATIQTQCFSKQQ
uniref:(northern house mosquito) hypothetical protein n=1 Tax=Culex pipiens TaxID=7175 RepID=A0A8D8CWB4_CULPI